MSTRIAIIMGSQSDLETVNEGVAILKRFRIPFEIKVLSAHRTPKEVARYVDSAPKRGIKVFIAAAGGAAALAGVVASHTSLPVIGIPIETSSLKGLDSLLSTVQMPGGIPVASMAIGKAGAKNAALFGIAILALSDKALSLRLVRYRREMAAAIKKIKLTL